MTASFTPNEPDMKPRPVMVPYERARYWRYCSMALGVGFVISLSMSSGPRSAGASEFGSMHLGPDQALSIGGVDSVDGEAVYVILGEDGEQVGMLPMNVQD